MEEVSWEDAHRFIEKLNQIEKTEGYRLPSEAEWEYACRAGTNTKYFFGNDARLLGEYAWYYDNSNKTTHQVASRKPNAWGLYDMQGNLSEWVEDDWHSSYEGAPTDGKAWIDNTRNNYTIRTLRGCNWKSVNCDCKSSHRDMYLPTAQRFDVGFRLAKSP